MYKQTRLQFFCYFFDIYFIDTSSNANSNNNLFIIIDGGFAKFVVFHVYKYIIHPYLIFIFINYK